MDAFRVVSNNYCRMVGYMCDDDVVSEFNEDMDKFYTLLDEYTKTKEED